MNINTNINIKNIYIYIICTLQLILTKYAISFSLKTLIVQENVFPINQKAGSKCSAMRLIQDQGKVREAFLTKAFDLEMKKTCVVEPPGLYNIYI